MPTRVKRGDQRGYTHRDTREEGGRTNTQPWIYVWVSRETHTLPVTGLELGCSRS